MLYKTLGGYENNQFVQNLLSNIPYPFDLQDIEKIIALYNLGTVSHGYRSGAITFPFIDVNNRVRAIQVKQFDESNHTTATDFLHSVLEKQYLQDNVQIPKWLQDYKENETKVSCLFAEHLLKKFPHNPIALVEAPKTAIYGTLYFGFPEQPTNLLWLAVYNLSSLNLNKCRALKGRNVFLFPDLSKNGRAFELWSKKALEIQKHLKGTYFHVSNLLEQLAPQQDRNEGKDFADYIAKHDWRLYRKPSIKATPETESKPVERSICEKSEKSEAPQKTFSSEQIGCKEKAEVLEFSEHPTKENEYTDKEVKELERFFKNAMQPNEPVRLNSCSVITDYALFVESQFNSIKLDTNKQTTLLCLSRLKELKQVLLTINSN